MLNCNVLFKLSGSIAAYKACEVISQLVKWGCQVRVVCTPNTFNFVGASTIEGLTGAPPLSNTFQEGLAMSHIHLEKWSDFTVFCPATANSINKLANGIGDDLVNTLFLAHNFSKKYFLVPAMNSNMWHHPRTKESIEKLRSWGVRIVDPGVGTLACGDIGPGRLAEPEDILQILFNEVNHRRAGKKIIITAGGTKERIDGVRTLSNTSTGKTGSDLANHLTALGCKVTFVGAENAVRPRYVNKFLSFSDFESLNRSLSIELQDSYDAVIHAAAVSDFSVDQLEYPDRLVTPNPMLKLSSESPFNIHLKKNFKILDQLRTYSRNKSIKIIGFKLTNTFDSREREAAVQKLFHSDQVDYVVHNDQNEISKGRPLYTLYGKEKSLLKITDSIQEMADQVFRRINPKKLRPVIRREAQL